MSVVFIPSGGGAASRIQLVANVGALPPAASVPIGSVRVTEDDGTLYVNEGTTWNSAGGGGSGVASVNGLTGVVTLQVGDGSIGSTGSNSLVYSNSVGELDNLPGWSVDPNYGGLSVGVTQNVINDGYHNFNYYNMVLDPSIASPTATWAHTSYDVTIDPNGSGFEIGTDGVAAIVNALNIRHEGTSDVGSLQFINLNGQIGNGTDPILVESVFGVNMFPNIRSGVTITQGITGYNFSPDIDAGVIFSNTGLTAFNDNTTIPDSIGGYTSANFSPNINEVQNNHNYTGININPTISTFTGNASANLLALAGTFDTLSATGNVNVINISPTITHLTNDCFGINISPTTTDGDAAWFGININSNNVNTTGSIRGIEVSVPTGLANLALSIQGHSNISADFAVLSGQVQQYGHVIGGQVNIPNATTVTGTDVLANNMAFTVNTGDATSDWTAASVVGLTTLGFVGQIIGDGAINGDINFCLNGYSDAHNGHIDRVNNFHAAAVPGGGTGTMGEAILFYGQMPFGLVATDNWGIRIDTAALENYVPKLAIGDMATKKVANASVGLELDSVTKAFLNARMTTTERDALTAINGMQIYNVTTDKFQGYAAGAWVDLH